jgi:hypothetical protein
MTSPTQWSLISVGALLVAPGTVLPPQWHVENDLFVSGWSRLANTLDGKRLESELAAAGWTFFFLASTITTTAFGLSRPRMFDAALAQLITAVTREKCNCVQIDEVGVGSILGLPSVWISAHPRHIQKGMIFSGH